MIISESRDISLLGPMVCPWPRGRRIQWDSWLALCSVRDQILKGLNKGVDLGLELAQVIFGGVLAVHPGSEVVDISDKAIKRFTVLDLAAEEVSRAKMELLGKNDVSSIWKTYMYTLRALSVAM
jgi:hypothetical protein